MEFLRCDELEVHLRLAQVECIGGESSTFVAPLSYRVFANGILCNLSFGHKANAVDNIHISAITSTHCRCFGIWAHKTRINIFGARSEETFNCRRCHDIIELCNKVKDTDRQPLAGLALETSGTFTPHSACVSQRPLMEFTRQFCIFNCSANKTARDVLRPSFPRSFHRQVRGQRFGIFIDRRPILHTFSFYFIVF